MDCVVCYESMTKDQNLECGHYLCKICLEQMLSTSCPICRTNPFKGVLVTDEILKKISGNIKNDFFYGENYIGITPMGEIPYPPLNNYYDYDSETYSSTDVVFPEPYVFHNVISMADYDGDDTFQNITNRMTGNFIGSFVWRFFHSEYIHSVETSDRYVEDSYHIPERITVTENKKKISRREKSFRRKERNFYNKKHTNYMKSTVK